MKRKYDRNEVIKFRNLRSINIKIKIIATPYKSGILKDKLAWNYIENSKSALMIEKKKHAIIKLCKTRHVYKNSKILPKVTIGRKKTKKNWPTLIYTDIINTHKQLGKT